MSKNSLTFSPQKVEVSFPSSEHGLNLVTHFQWIELSRSENMWLLRIDHIDIADFFALSLFLFLTCSGGSQLVCCFTWGHSSRPMERSPWWGTKPSSSQARVPSWKCVSTSPSLVFRWLKFQLKKPQRDPETESPYPEELLPKSWATETEIINIYCLKLQLNLEIIYYAEINNKCKPVTNNLWAM